MLFDLALGFDDKAEVRAIAGHAGGQSDCERACIPQGIDQTRAVVELGETLLRPREMLFFLARRVREAAADRAVACGQGLRLIQRLRAHFPRSEEHTSELQSRENLVCRLLLEKK